MKNPNRLDFSNIKIPILVGPTGVGKSEIAFALSKKLDLEILSADAYQIYKGLPIGTAQPPLAWQKQTPHYLVGVRKPGLSWSAAEFAIKAKKIIENRIQSGKRILIVGGAGFYIRALVEGLPNGSKVNPKIRTGVAEKLKIMNHEEAHKWLSQIDPAASKRIHVNDSRRISRALEKALDPSCPDDFEPIKKDHVDFYGLDLSSENLDIILKNRIEAMWVNGLLAELENLTRSGISPQHPIWSAIGYFEALAFLRGEIPEKVAKELIFRRTRQYAKRQRTWFKRQHQVEWINLDHIGKETAVEILAKKINANWRNNANHSD